MLRSASSLPSFAPAKDPSAFRMLGKPPAAVLETGDMYGETLTELYQGVNTPGECEGNVNAWLAAQIARLAGGRRVLDAGCGAGRFLPLLAASGMHSYCGVDGSADMLSQIAGIADHGIEHWPLAGSAGALVHRERAFVCGDLCEVLPGLGPVVELVLSSFNLVCFESPEAPIAAIRACLRPGGRLLCVTNTFVPAALHPDDATPHLPVPVDMQRLRRSRAELGGKRRFRHILHLPGGALPLQDHMHPIEAIAGALGEDAWEVESAAVFAAQGCSLAHPADPRFALFGAAGPDIHDPADGGGLKYVKLGFVARRKA